MGETKDSKKCTPKITDESVRQKLRDTLKIIDNIFQTNNITYWIDGGTLLGAVRHKDVIPWDDDGDIVVLNSDIDKLEAIKSTLNELGLGLVKTWHGYKIYPLDGKTIKIKYEYKYPFVDIFFAEKINDNRYHFSDKAVKNIWKNYYHQIPDLFPLKKYPFGNIEVMGPNNPIPYLDRSYGPNWRSKGLQNYDHSRESKITKIVFNVAEVDLLTK